MASRTLTLTQALNRAVSAYKAGKLVEAEQICQQIISAKNDLFDAQYLLAVAQSSLGKNDLALASFDKALALKPDCAQAYYNRGVSLQDLNRLNEAVASFDKALALDPSHAEAFNNRGNALKDLDRHEEALGSFDRALSVRQDYVKALYNRGVTLQELSRFDEALASFDKGLAVQPDYAEAFNNRGVALKELKRLDEALTSFDKALAVSPEYAQAHYNRGVILQELNRIEEALASFDKAFALNPHLAEAVNNRGVALMKLKRLDEALASFGEALALKPDYADAFYNRGIILQELARFDEALASYEHALAVKPNHTRAFSGTVDCLNKLCDWRRTSNIADDVIAHVLEKKSIISPFALLGYSGDPLLQLQCARNFVADRVPSLLRPLWTGARWRHDKLRVAYLSADFRSHPVSYLTAGLFEQHDRSRFEIIGISFGVDDRSEMRQRLIAAFDEFHDVRRKSDEEVAKLLHDRQIDIAIDLMGYTQESRPGIFAYRPAPIQASYLGFPGTMGAEFIDYIIADKTVAPFEHQSYYTEKIVHLPDCFQVNDSKRKIAAHTPTREEAGLPAEGFVFCCFNNNWKITPTIFDVWMRLLSAVEGSVLWLSQANDAAVRNLRREADARGIETSRLVFAPRVLRLDDHLARHRLADLFLDTLPYNAHTTASDALWAGLPVVTRLGDAFAGRVAASLLCAVGVPELITSSLEEYQALALKLARDPALPVI
jgi:protein O-GlcNAc transferase